MQSNSKFLPGFPTKLHGRPRRRQLETLRRERDRARSESLSDLATLFDFVLPIEEVAAASRTERERIFPEPVVFWAWVSQILGGNESCARATAAVQAWHAEAGIEIPSPNTSSYCRARSRLSEEFLDDLDGLCARHAEARMEGHDHWRGLRIKLVDGTNFDLPDTPENQERFPQSSQQKQGCGFPAMSAVAVLDAASGRMERACVGDRRKHDARGLHDLLGHFGENDLVVADRAFCAYELIGQLAESGAHSLMRLHQRRDGKALWKVGRRCGPDSRLITWTKPPKPGACGTTREQWERLPDTVEIRLVRTRAPGRDGEEQTIYLATTLLDAKTHPCGEIAGVYLQRWNIEVRFRDMKTTLRLEQLRARTPEIAEKMLRVAMIAYNLLKALMKEASAGHDVLLDEVGFKRTVDLVAEFRAGFRGLQNKPRLLAAKRALLEERIREKLLNIRPGRSEPRAVKRRPKHHQFLTAPRSEFRETFHRGKRKAA